MDRLKIPENFLPDRASLEKRCRPGERFDVFTLDGPGCVRHLWISPGLGKAGRNIVLRVYFDGEAVPSVQAPLADFFGVMHGAEWYPIDTEYISVLERVGYNCYFPMPFASKARFELEIGDEPAFICAMADWHRYEELDEPLRFRARWTRESPTERYGREYRMLDADGPGELAGFFLGVRLKDDADRWSHGGAENIYLDGEETPVYIRGVGGEDTFGTAFGGALHAPDTRLYCGMPYYVHEDTGEARPAQRVVGYRFYKKDRLPFRRSIHMRFGCMGNDVCSTVYWYSAAPVREWFRFPPLSALKTNGAFPFEAHALPLPACGGWAVCGPFPASGGFDPAAFLKDGTAFKPDKTFPLDTGKTYGPAASGCARWSVVRAEHGFVDFRWLYRPRLKGVSPTEEGFAAAVCTLDAPRDGTIALTFTYDDVLYLSFGGVVKALPAHAAFRTETIRMPVRKGPNRLAIALTNTAGGNHGGWCFAMRAEDERGFRITPSAPEGYEE